MNPNHLSSAEQRARAILDAYGSNPNQWPPAEVQPTLDCLANSPTLQQYQAQIAPLDMIIQSEQQLTLQEFGNQSPLQQRILATLPPQSPAHDANFANSSAWRRILDWLVMPRFAIAIASAAVLAIALLVTQAPQQQTMALASNEFDAWAWYDITGQELPEQTTATTLTMMDLIDLEVYEDDG